MSREKKEQLAIIKDVRCGVLDRGWPVLTFTTYLTENYCASQHLSWDLAGEMIEAYGVSDVSQLNGMPCWVETDGIFVTYKRPWKS